MTTNTGFSFIFPRASQSHPNLPKSMSLSDRKKESVDKKNYWRCFPFWGGRALLSFTVGHGVIVHFYQSIAGLRWTLPLERICCVIKLALNCEQKHLKLGKARQAPLGGLHFEISLVGVGWGGFRGEADIGVAKSMVCDFSKCKLISSKQCKLMKYSHRAGLIKDEV